MSHILTSSSLQYKFWNLTYKAAAITDVMNILKAELASDSEPLARLCSGYHWEQLIVLVASGKAKEMIGEALTQD